MKTRWTVVWVAVWLGMISCVGAPGHRPAPRYYLLEYSPPPFASVPALPVALEVGGFSVAAAFDRNALVYRSRDHVYPAYAYRFWRVNPGDMLGDFLGRDLRRAGMFCCVVRPESSVPARFRLEGEIEELYESDEGETWWAVLTVVATLVDTAARHADRMVVFQKTYRVRERCSRKTPRGVVEAVSRAAARFSHQLAGDLYCGVRRRLGLEASPPLCPSPNGATP